MRTEPTSSSLSVDCLSSFDPLSVSAPLPPTKLQQQRSSFCNIIDLSFLDDSKNLSIGAASPTLSAISATNSDSLNSSPYLTSRSLSNLGPTSPTAEAQKEKSTEIKLTISRKPSLKSKKSCMLPSSVPGGVPDSVINKPRSKSVFVPDFVKPTSIRDDFDQNKNKLIQPTISLIGTHIVSYTHITKWSVLYKDIPLTTVELHHGQVFGSRKLYVNGKKIHSSRKMLKDSGSEHCFELINTKTHEYILMSCSISIDPKKSDKFVYSLERVNVTMESLKNLCK